MAFVLFFLLFTAFVNANCADWALRKFSDDYLDCYNKANNDVLEVRQCLREWKMSLYDSDCVSQHFKSLFKEFCNGHNGGSFICDFE
ncbi:Uncharacterized protein QTN25_004476 [Entamoeba marina]